MEEKWSNPPQKIIRLKNSSTCNRNSLKMYDLKNREELLLLGNDTTHWVAIALIGMS